MDDHLTLSVAFLGLAFLHHTRINLSAGSFVGQCREFSAGDKMKNKERLHLFPYYLPY
jgi:hypothetical protein